MDGMQDNKRSMLEELLKLAMEHRAMGLKSKLSPVAQAEPDPEMPGQADESADAAPEGDGEPDAETLKELLARMTGMSGE